MKIYYPILLIEINNSEYIFTAGDENKQGDFKLVYKCIVPLEGIQNYRITDLDLVFKIVKKNIYIIEQELNFTFKEVVLILNNFNCSFINLTGFKKLNGSQILKENITYILNSLKSNIDKIEDKKTILHIFNSKYSLDRKKIDNLPVGLFGDFYSHELSFCLINNNDYKNLNHIFDKCNIKIKKVLLKSFVEGSSISNSHEDLDTFYQIKINNNYSQVIFFENDSLKFEQNFNFGSDLIIKDISKVTSLKTNIVRKIIDNIILNQDITKEELIEKNYFENENYVKIKKFLLLEIAKARIKEIINILIIKNINFAGYDNKDKNIFIKIKDESHLECFKDTYASFFTKNNLSIKFINNISTENLMSNVNKLVHFGWNKEAIPTTHPQRSTIARFFDLIFS
jgi:cell division protein FtsA